LSSFKGLLKPLNVEFVASYQWIAVVAVSHEKFQSLGSSDLYKKLTGQMMNTVRALFAN